MRKRETPMVIQLRGGHQQESHYDIGFSDGVVKPISKSLLRLHRKIGSSAVATVSGAAAKKQPTECYKPLKSREESLRN